MLSSSSACSFIATDRIATVLVMAACTPQQMRTIYFAAVVSIFLLLLLLLLPSLPLPLLLFHRLISAVADWMSTIPCLHMVWPYLECRPEMCCTRLAGNRPTERKNDAKIAICAPSHKFVELCLRN